MSRDGVFSSRRGTGEGLLPPPSELILPCSIRTATLSPRADRYPYLRLDTGGAIGARLEPQRGALTQPRPTAWVQRYPTYGFPALIRAGDPKAGCLLTQAAGLGFATTPLWGSKSAAAPRLSPASSLKSRTCSARGERAAHPPPIPSSPDEGDSVAVDFNHFARPVSGKARQGSAQRSKEMNHSRQQAALPRKTKGRGGFAAAEPFRMPTGEHLRFYFAVDGEQVRLGEHHSPEAKRQAVARFAAGLDLNPGMKMHEALCLVRAAALEAVHHDPGVRGAPQNGARVDYAQMPVGMVRAAHPKEAAVRAGAYPARLWTPPDAETCPDFGLLLTVNPDGVMRGGGAFVGTHAPRLVSAGAGVHHHALPAHLPAHSPGGDALERADRLQRQPPLPRLRYDRLMDFGWKVLLPVATFNLILTAVAVAFGGGP